MKNCLGNLEKGHCDGLSSNYHRTCMKRVGKKVGKRRYKLHCHGIVLNILITTESSQIKSGSEGLHFF